jgi:hypothetical protein
VTLDQDKSADLVGLVCWLAKERGTTLTTVQLVKYLYLADLFHARRNEGRTLTGWPWAFVHFGPYCSEALSAIDRAAGKGLIARDSYESRYDDKEFFLHRALIRDEPDIADAIPMTVVSGLKIMLQKWADDSAGLLDYVYFDTEPMKDIQPGSRLDFSTATVPVALVTTIPPKKLSTKKERAAADIIAKLCARTLATPRSTPLDTGPYDDGYFDAVMSDEEPESELEFEGRVGIDSLEGGKVDE